MDPSAMINDFEASKRQTIDAASSPINFAAMQRNDTEAYQPMVTEAGTEVDKVT